MSFKCTNDTKLWDFQFRILNRILTTNILFKKLKIQEEDLCSYCNEDRETISHLFYDCVKVKEFWRNTERWLSQYCIEPVRFSREDVLLCTANEKQVLHNHIILMVKYYIYCNKFKKEILSRQHVINCGKRQCTIEKQVAYSQKKLTMYYQKWATLHYILCDQ